MDCLENKKYVMRWILAQGAVLSKHDKILIEQIGDELSLLEGILSDFICTRKIYKDKRFNKIKKMYLDILIDCFSEEEKEILRQARKFNDYTIIDKEVKECSYMTPKKFRG